MAFHDIMAEIGHLIREMENQPNDRHEIYLELRGKLNEIRATGMPVPDDLVRVHRRSARAISPGTAAAATVGVKEPRQSPPCGGCEMYLLRFEEAGKERSAGGEIAENLKRDRGKLQAMAFYAMLPPLPLAQVL